MLYIKYANGQKDVFTTIEQNQELTRYAFPKNYLSRSGQTYILDGHAMRHEEYSNFLQAQCPSAYNVYREGHKTSQAGWVLLGLGGALDILSIIMLATSRDLSVTYASVAAGALEIASIPTLIVGYCKMHNSADIFNTQCAKQQSTAYWSINADSNGIGLALNF